MNREQRNLVEYLDGIINADGTKSDWQKFLDLLIEDLTRCQVGTPMEDKMNKIRNFKNDEEMIQSAAEGCYYPLNKQREFAVALVIERLVLPDDVDDYNREDMAEFIRLALIDVARRNERVVGVVDE